MPKDSLPAALNPHSNGLSSYLATVYAQPILSAEEERDYAIRYREHEDLDAARQLVLSHLRFVVKVAREFAGYGIPLPDLIQEGSVGLMKAVKRYDPDREVRLVSFAVHWIKAEIYDFILKNWKIVRIATTKAHRKLFFNLRSHRQSLESMTESEISALAEELDVPEETVREMEIRMSGNAVSFDPNLEDDSEDSPTLTPSNYLGDRTYNPEDIYEKSSVANHRSEQLQHVLSVLDERSRDIIVQRWLNEDKSTLHSLAQKYKVSAERIRQIEEKAMQTMRAEFSDAEFAF